MPYTNIKSLLIDATKYPVAIEAKLPAGAPKVSTMLLNAANQIPTVPDFPMAVPDLPAVPTLPTMPGQAAAGLTRYVTAVEVVPQRLTPSPTVTAGGGRIIEGRGF